MEEKKRNKFLAFLLSPIESDEPPLLANRGDWFAALGTIVFAVSVFSLPWLGVGVKSADFGFIEKSYGLFASPWVWVLVAWFVAIFAGFWFVQTKGVISLSAGIFCLLFNVAFYFGARYKVSMIVGDVVSLARAIPLVGGEVSGLGMVSVKLAMGYFVMIGAGVLLVVGGLFRLLGWGEAGELPEE